MSFIINLGIFMKQCAVATRQLLLTSQARVLREQECLKLSRRRVITASSHKIMNNTLEKPHKPARGRRQHPRQLVPTQTRRNPRRCLHSVQPRHGPCACSTHPVPHHDETTRKTLLTHRCTESAGWPNGRNAGPGSRSRSRPPNF